MRVVFLSPSYPPEMIQYTRGLAEVGAEVLGVGDTPREALPAAVKPHLHDYLQVPRIMDEDDVIERVTAWLRGREVDRVLANWEPLVILAARIRERWGMPGMSVDTVRGFRDKQLMKERVAAAGLRVPRSRRVFTGPSARRRGRGDWLPADSQAHRGGGQRRHLPLRHPAELDGVLAAMRYVTEASCEEYIEGEEFTFDTVCIDGVPVYENIAAYLPKPIEMRSQEWISPVIITVRDMYQPRLMPGVELGRACPQGPGHGRRLHPHGVVSHPQGRGHLRRDRVPPRRRPPRRPDELLPRHRPLPRVGPRGRAISASRPRPRASTTPASSSSAPRARGASPASRASATGCATPALGGRGASSCAPARPAATGSRPSSPTAT
jgi:hypothetical protein